MGQGIDVIQSLWVGSSAWLRFKHKLLAECGRLYNDPFASWPAFWHWETTHMRKPNLEETFTLALSLVCGQSAPWLSLW